MKRIMMILVAVVSALALCSCGSSAQTKGKSSKKKMDVPFWFNNPPQEENAVFATHSATKSSMALALDVAKNRARNELSSVVERTVANMIKDHMKEAGTVNASVATELSASVSKSLTAATLSGSTLVQQEIYELDNDGDGNTDAYEVYVLLKVSDLGKRISETMKENKAAFAEMQAEKDFEELEAELSKIKWSDPEFKAQPQYAEE
ncbi:MAG: hypothetical protein J6B11_10615 [Spirochaetales bacterium]|nr:hypothetical protein [Spirochaetales bacterium]